MPTLGTSVNYFVLFFVMGVMITAYIFAKRWNFYSLVDVVWAYVFSLVAFIYGFGLDGWHTRNLVMVAMVIFWSFRLGTHLFVRLKKHFPKEDSRYVELKQKWAANLNSQFFMFFMFQGFSVVVLSLPFLLIANNTSTEFHFLEYLAMAVWFVGVVGESTADAQLRRFVTNPENRGQVCNIGLWNYSRHPNYFFEWVIWVGYGLFAWTAPNGEFGILSPMIILYLLLKVTGVPYAEKQSLKSKGDKYREYQRTTSPFFPWPRRR